MLVGPLKQAGIDPMGVAQALNFPSEDVLSRYGSGCLEPSLSLLLESQAALNPEVARKLEASLSVASYFFVKGDGVPMASDALDRALAALDGPDGEALASPIALPENLAFLPTPLQRLVSESLKTHKWRFLKPGLRSLKIEFEAANDDGVEIELLRIAPGHGAPRHSHEGLELTLCLQGAFRDEVALYGPGDVSVATPKLTHRPVAEPGETCYALAMSEAPVRLTGALGLLQRALSA